MAWTKTDDWWRDAIFYQVYVRSWRDSNGDGIGDLAGVREGLDYLEWLGTDAIWLSPTMPSPGTDCGYDVSDYYGVHPELGTMADLDGLIDDAGKRGIAVLMDLVPNHTSSAHPWFIDAISGRAAKHRDYYVWASPKPDGSLPNNWLDITGAPGWALDERSGQYYFHNFLVTQPDLNWWNEDVHKEFEDILQFWFARGVAGFRIDVANALYKDALLRDNPPPPPSGRPTLKYNSNRPEVHGIYQRWRQIADSYEPRRALLGETWALDYNDFGDYYGREEPELHMGFNFFFALATLSAPELAAVVDSTLSALPPGANPVWTASNHDLGRFATRWCAGDTRAVKAVLVLLATLPGTVLLYYGDELGLADVDVPPELQLDQMATGGLEGQSRDRCRTPMPWSAEKNGGFTTSSARPWLPLGEHSATNVQSEKAVSSSVLNFWRELAGLRRSRQIGSGQARTAGTLERVALDDQLWAYRVGEVTTVANLSNKDATISLGEHSEHRVVVSTQPNQQGVKLAGKAALGPWEAFVLRPSGA